MYLFTAGSICKMASRTPPPDAGVYIALPHAGVSAATGSLAAPGAGGALKRAWCWIKGMFKPRADGLAEKLIARDESA